MALVRQPQYDVRGNSEEGTRSSDGYVDTSTGEIFRGQRVGDSENGFEYVTVPTGQTWDKMNKADPSGRNIYGSQGYAPEQYTSEGDESYGTSYSPSNVAGMTPSGDIQIAESMDRKGYADVLAKYGITPKYDPQYGYVLPSNVHNAVTQEYFKNAGLGQYQERDGVTGFIDKYAVPLMMAATGYGMASGFGGAAAAAEAGTAGLATAETAALAGDAFLPGALSNPFLQAMPTVSSMAQSAATNAAMQLATTGTIDPEKIFTSVITGAAGSTLGNLAGNAAANALDSNLVRSVVSGAVSGATQAGINGTDPMAAALASGAASGLGYAGKLNGIDIPQKAINAVVSSVATGAPLENTLLNAAISIGVGAAKDAVSNISLTDTQAPAPVETRIPISPLPADSGNVTTAELSDTSPSGYVIAGTEVPANADGSIYSGLSTIGSGTNVAANTISGTIVDVGNGIIGTAESPRSVIYKSVDEAKSLNPNIKDIYADSNGNIYGTKSDGEITGLGAIEDPNSLVNNTPYGEIISTEQRPTDEEIRIALAENKANNLINNSGQSVENTVNTGALSSIDGANINNNTSTAADTKTAVGFNDYSDLVYETVDGIFVDSSNNPVAAPSTKLDGTPFNDTLTGSATGAANTVVGGLSSVAGVNGAGSILDGSSTVDGTITGGQGRTGADATFIDGGGNVVDGSGNLVTGGHNDTLIGGVTTDPVITTPANTTTVTPAVTTTVTPANNTTNTSTTTGTGRTTAPASAAEKARAIDMAPTYAYLQPTMLTTGKAGSSMPLFTGLDPKLASILNRAKGGSIHPNLQRVLSDRGYNPVEMVAGPEDRYYARHAKRGFAVNGAGTGQSDDIPTMLADGEYVFDADTVAALGDGSTKAGAAALDKMREEIRKHKRSAPVDKIPPKARSPLDYLARKGK